ncbi:hypothetical protein ANO11243_030360 [Dothideomycetidae sp. 11243]|nr:hypothetical protein ANO11243_030360 [fungal sp. No.11243]
MVWPFSRGRGKRLSGLGQTSALSAQDTSEKTFDPNNPRNATPRNAPRNPDDSSLRKRRRSPEYPLEKPPLLPDEKGAQLRRHRSRGSTENITALPGARRLETSPHLRPSDTYRTASMARRAAQLTDEKSKPRPDAQKRRLSKRQEYHTKAMREGEIRAMTAPPPKRDSANGDLLVRENKKARRVFSSKAGDDHRASTVSLPFQESIHSSMSGSSESRGWEIPKLHLFSPRPTVRLSSSLGHSVGHGAGHGLYRSTSKKEKLPTLQEGVKRKDRRRMAELADELDAADLRVLMERDTRRKDKKQIADKEKLEAKLRRRASKSRAKERDVPPSPAAVHPAFRQNQPSEIVDTPAKAHTTSSTVPAQFDEQLVVSPRTGEAVDPDSEGPFRDALTPSYTDSVKGDYVSGFQREDTPVSVIHTPLETPFEVPVLGTAEEIRYAHGRLSHVSMSPPISPMMAGHPRDVSPLRREFTPELSLQPPSSSLRHSESANTKKAGTWASIFRRSGTTSRTETSFTPRVATSFSNTSRDSMSKQPLPAHLVATGPRRRSGTPARTHSIFREDLPESNSAFPDSRVNSPDLIAAGNIAAARRIKHGSSGLNSEHGQIFDASGVPHGRSKSPADTDGRNSEVAMSTSLASVDSEGSWLTGRPSKRKSTQSHVRNSIGSMDRRRESYNRSYEELGVPDDQIVRRLTPSPEDEAKEAEAGDETPVTEQMPEEGLPLQRNTSRRKPNLVVRTEGAKSREGLMASIGGPETATNRASLSGDSTRSSVYGTESEDDQVDDGFDKHEVVYGRGHARQLSSGSAKVLEIPSRTRTSISSNLDAHARSSTGLQSPPLSPAHTRE